MTESTKKKKEWSVRGVSFGPSLKKHALEMEKALNELTDEGYDVQMSTMKNGMIIIGRLQQTQVGGQQVGDLSGIPAMMVLMGGPPGGGNELLSSQTKQLIVPLMQLMERGSDNDIEKMAETIVQKSPAEHIHTAMLECEKYVADHEERHSKDPQHSCSTPKHMRRIVQLLKKKLSANLQ